MEERAFEHYFYVKNNVLKKSMFFIVLFCIFVSGSSGTIIVAKGGTFTMNGGTISDCEARYGAAVSINSGGTFNFYGGTIKNMTEVNGGSIYGSGTMNRKVSETTLTNASVHSNVTVNNID